MLVALAKKREGPSVVGAEADSLEEVSEGLVEAAASVDGEVELRALGEGVGALARGEGLGGRRGEGGVEGAEGGESVTLEIEGEGFKDVGGGIARVEGDGAVGLGGRGAGEGSGAGAGRGGASAGEELAALKEVAVGGGGGVGAPTEAGEGPLGDQLEAQENA